MTETEGTEPKIKSEAIKDILVSRFSDRRMPEALFSLSGGIQPDERGGYKSTTFNPEDKPGVAIGGKARSIASAEIAKIVPEIKIVTTSHYYPDQPSHASVIAHELIKRGVEPDRISLEEASINTITELVEMIKMAVERNWRRIIAITNEYHLPRIQEMYRQLDSLCQETDFLNAMQEFKKMEGEICFISADEILSLISDHWIHFLEEVKKTPAYQATLEAENRGLQDLRGGRYRVSLGTKPPSKI